MLQLTKSTPLPIEQPADEALMTLTLALALTLTLTLALALALALTLTLTLTLSEMRRSTCRSSPRCLKSPPPG